MSVPFLISGLPRSRTAWLSAFFSTSDSLCYHDLTNYLSDPHTVVSHLRAEKCLYAGDSDSGLMFDPDALEFIPEDVPMLLVCREIAEVKASLQKLFGKASFGKYLRTWEEMLDRYHASREALVRRSRAWGNTIAVPYTGLDSEKSVRAIWAHLMPEIPWDSGRWHVFRGLNIQANTEKYKELMACLPSGDR